MNKIIKRASGIRGKITFPGDKSISHRATILASIAKGDTTIVNYSTSQEFESTLNCLRQYGIEIEQPEDEKNKLIIHGKGLEGFSKPEGILNAGNSSATVRLLMGIAAACPFESTFDGSEKLRSKIESDNFKGPITIQGGNLQAIKYIMPLSTSQVKGAVFSAGLFADGVTELIERIPSRDHFERLMSLMKIKFNKEKVQPAPPQLSDEFERRLRKLNKSAVLEPRGGLFTLPGNQEPRANIKSEVTGRQGYEPTGTIITSNSPLKGRRIVGEVIPTIIDELPIMAIIATQAQGTTVIRDAFELRHKETDRIKTVVTNLRKMGARIGELEDGMAIDGGTDLVGAEISSHGDHRIAMAFAIAGLIAKGETVIKDAECVATSHPTFWEDLDSVAQY